MAEYIYDIDKAFPKADLPMTVFGSRVLVQLRSPPQQTAGGIVLADDTKKREADIVQVAKILSCGPLAFCSRQTGQKWPEGSWAEVGEFILTPRYGGDRWKVKLPSGEEVYYGLFNDLDLSGKCLGDPLTVRTFI